MVWPYSCNSEAMDKKLQANSRPWKSMCDATEDSDDSDDNDVGN